MKRVAQVIAGAAQGGAESMYTRLTKGLQASGEFEQRAFLRNHPHRVEALRAGGVSTEAFRFGGALDLVDRFQFRRALKAWNPDLIMTWMNRAAAATPRGDYLLVSRLGHFYNLKYYRRSDYWVGNTQGICDHLIAGGMPADRVFLIRNFADETPVQPLPRDSFDTPADQPLLIAAGRLHVNKAFDTLLRALVSVPDATLWLAGSGPEEQNLKQLASELGISERVRFLGWRNDVTALMASGDLFVCPSRHEGLGSIVMEAWSRRCPIVATRSQGPGEVIEHGVTGLLTPIDDVVALAEAINQPLRDAALRERLAEQGLAHYQAHYSERAIVGQYNALYRDLLARVKP